MPSKAKKQKSPPTPGLRWASKKIKKQDRIKKSDLLPESREFLLEKELVEEKGKKIKETKLVAAEDKSIAKAKYAYEDDSHKRLAMWTGVIFFMALIFFIWVYNIKATFRAPANNNKESDLSWDKISEDFKKTMGEVKENIADLKSAVQTATTTEERQLSKEEIEKLKEKLQVMENNLGTSTKESNIATSSEN